MLAKWMFEVLAEDKTRGTDLRRSPRALKTYHPVTTNSANKRLLFPCPAIVPKQTLPF